MSEIRDKAKKKMAKILKYHGVFDIEDEILSIPELAIVDRDAELPVGVFEYEQHKRILKEAGWVKEIPKR